MEEFLFAAAIGNLNWQEIENGILHQLQRKPKRIRALEYGKFDLNALTAEEVKSNFRFDREHLPRLAAALGIPDKVQSKEKHVCNQVEALCIALRRLVYPNRLFDLEPLFGLSGQSLSYIANTVIELIYNNTSHLLLNLGNLRWLNKQKLQTYAEVIECKGGPIANCWGFIDGTARAICRPKINQRDYFSGHKRGHCVKYQSVVCPDGIIVSLCGGYEGKRHDAGIFRDSQFYDQLRMHTQFPNGDDFVLYGDQGYGIRELLLRPYGHRDLTDQQQIFNNSMSSLRQCVEWSYGKVVSEFAFVDFKKNQKLLLQDVVKMYFVATVLTNCHTCLYGSQTSSYFNLLPPELEEYLCL